MRTGEWTQGKDKGLLRAIILKWSKSLPDLVSMNASTDSPQGQTLFSERSKRVLKTLIQIVNTTWNIQSVHFSKIAFMTI